MPGPGPGLCCLPTTKHWQARSRPGPSLPAAERSLVALTRKTSIICVRATRCPLDRDHDSRLCDPSSQFEAPPARPCSRLCSNGAGNSRTLLPTAQAPTRSKRRRLAAAMWVDGEAEARLCSIFSTIEDELFRDTLRCTKLANPLLICSNIDARAAKEESDEWKDWADFFTIRAVGSSLSLDSRDFDFFDEPLEEEIICIDDSTEDSSKRIGPTFRHELLQGLVDSVICDKSIVGVGFNISSTITMTFGSSNSSELEVCGFPRPQKTDREENLSAVPSKFPGRRQGLSILLPALSPAHVPTSSPHSDSAIWSKGYVLKDNLMLVRKGRYFEELRSEAISARPPRCLGTNFFNNSKNKEVLDVPTKVIDMPSVCNDRNHDKQCELLSVAHGRKGGIGSTMMRPRSGFMAGMVGSRAACGDDATRRQPACCLRRSNSLVDRTCSVPPRDALRAGPGASAGGLCSRGRAKRSESAREMAAGCLREARLQGGKKCLDQDQERQREADAAKMRRGLDGGQAGTGGRAPPAGRTHAKAAGADRDGAGEGGWDAAGAARLVGRVVPKLLERRQSRRTGAETWTRPPLVAQSRRAAADAEWGQCGAGGGFGAAAETGDSGRVDAVWGQAGRGLMGEMEQRQQGSATGGAGAGAGDGKTQWRRGSGTGSGDVTGDVPGYNQGMCHVTGSWIVSPRRLGRECG